LHQVSGCQVFHEADLLFMPVPAGKNITGDRSALFA
jgi:hypothetical protein